ncbi:MAG: hypothetical protein EAZ24_03215 [Burkholderiales bacterium]|nr:MAG: hypothetical protein EAZ21_03655 [Betaproteobacteria bacterium]TAG83160.1 MAG: hypothetical protein EAZ24_03215 [Burkholderiales bacterium]
MAADLAPVFERLKAILVKHAPRATVLHDTADHYYLNESAADQKGKAVFLAAAKIGAGKVAFHLMPVYAKPELLADISPALKKRMQGKSCFNFSSVDDVLLKELEALTKKAMNR